MPEFRIDKMFIAEQNNPLRAQLQSEYAQLGEQLQRRGRSIDVITKQVEAFEVAVPSWGVGTGGTRFARFPGPGEPRNVFEKLADCATIHQLTRATPRVSLHIPWDMQRYARCCPRELVNRRTIGKLFENIARLSRTRKTRKPRPARSHSP